MPAAGTSYRMAGVGPDSILFQGNALRHFQALALALARPALSSGGPLPEVVEDLLVEFIRRADRDGEEPTVGWLEGHLSAPVEEWRFVESLNAYFDQARLHVGACIATKDLAELGVDVPTLTHEPFRPPYLSTTVQGRGRASARLLAIERIAEAKALVALASSPSEVSDVKHLFASGGTYGYSSGRRATLNVVLVDSTGKLWPGYHELSEALRRAEDERSDWEERVASAARWWHRASSTSWPSEVVVAGISTLECLLIKPGEVREKAKLVARRMTEVAVLGGMSATRQDQWLFDLYKRRNEALHAGRFYQDDLDANRLLALVDLGIHWAVKHLDPWHKGTKAGPCKDIDEVLGPHERATGDIANPGSEAP